MSKRIAGGVINNDIYVPDAPPRKPTCTLDEILDMQMRALEEVTVQMLGKARGIMSKDDIQGLATIIKVTLDLKTKEKSLLDDLSDEELDALLKTKV